MGGTYEPSQVVETFKRGVSRWQLAVNSTLDALGVIGRATWCSVRHLDIQVVVGLIGYANDLSKKIVLLAVPENPTNIVRIDP